eukprot:3852804-Prymnesium_polylepis.1
MARSATFSCHPIRAGGNFECPGRVEESTHWGAAYRLWEQGTARGGVVWCGVVWCPLSCRVPRGVVSVVVPRAASGVGLAECGVG